ncbi:MAG: protein-L-isoaspartate(D-aspartate) O-methyltransferase [Exilispira sp.]
MEIENNNLNNMVEFQIVKRGINNPKIIEVFKTIDRKLFIAQKYQHLAYEDSPVSIGYGQTISQPYIVALMTELLELNGEERVLEIGTGSGYQTAILAKLAREVYTVERIVELLEIAKMALGKLNFDNIKFFHSNGYHGLPDYAPYDRIILTACPRKIPSTFYNQLGEKGILVAPEGDYIQNLFKIKKVNGQIIKEEIIPVRFVPLISEE